MTRFLFFVGKLNCESNDRSDTEGLELIRKPFGGRISPKQRERKWMEGGFYEIQKKMVGRHSVRRDDDVIHAGICVCR